MSQHPLSDGNDRQRANRQYANCKRRPENSHERDELFTSFPPTVALPFTFSSTMGLSTPQILTLDMSPLPYFARLRHLQRIH
jgi:hypothetical protein